jgi:hypothetical protein
MGTTLTAVAVMAAPDITTRLVVVNVGDSRTYVRRSGRLRRVTVDHSYVQELVSTGHITEMEARNHPRRNIVTRALGIEPSVKVDTWVLPLVRGDRYVLCSDGLVDEVDDDEINSVLATVADPQEAAEALVLLANHHGGRDNTTVVVVDVLEGDEPGPDTGDIQQVEPDWADDHERLIDAEAGAPVLAAAPTAAALGATRHSAHRTHATTVMPSVEPVTSTRRKGLGTLLFVVGLAAIVTITVVLVLVVRHNSNSPITPATTSVANSVPSSTSTSTTLPRTTTTLPPSTTTQPSVPTTVK